jgi:hypothetical protein
MHALLFVPVALPLACLASVSLFGFLGVFAIAGALQVVAFTSGSTDPTPSPRGGHAGD